MRKFVPVLSTKEINALILIIIIIITSAVRLLALRGLQTLRVCTRTFGPRMVENYSNSAYPSNGQTNKQTYRQTTIVI